MSLLERRIRLNNTCFVALAVLFPIAIQAFSSTLCRLDRPTNIFVSRSYKQQPQLLYHSPSNHHYFPLPYRKAASNLVCQRRDQVSDLIDEATDEGQEDWGRKMLDSFDADDIFTADEEDEWIPDREKARRIRSEANTARAERLSSMRAASGTSSVIDANAETTENAKKKSPYTEEQESLISAMGGKYDVISSNKREEGYLGDFTLSEISHDYGCPIVYLADVLCMWGVPAPIDIHTMLGDMVTGEQAFAILEALHSLDMAALNDRYSNNNMVSICDDFSIDLKEAFDMAVKEGWSLPFGVRTHLRVEQEDELIRVLGSYDWDDEDDDDYDF